MTIRNQITVKRDKTKWYILSLALFIFIGVGLFANPVQATEQWSQYGKPASVPSTELGGFYYPFSVAIDNSGNMYVADTGNQRIQKLVATDVPKAPTVDLAVAGDQQATISFTAPADDGGSAITSYTVTANPGGKTESGATSPITVTGLTNGTPYTFTVVATNIEGNSVASSEVSNV